MSWTPEQDAMLRQLAAEKYAGSAAAEAINARFGTAYTRSATIARTHRIGVRFNSAPRKERLERRKSPNPIVVEEKPMPQIEVAPELPFDPPPSAAPVGVGFFDLPNFGACRFPLQSAETGIENFLYCGEPVAHDDCKYCAAHAAIAYRPLSWSEKKGNWSIRRFARDLTTGAL